MSDRDRSWRIVTPEAVALELEASGIASRVLAGLLDALAIWVAFWALSTGLSLIAQLVGVTGGDDPVLLIVLYIVGSFLLLFAWPITWELTTGGRSPGKMALGIRVVTLEGAPIRFRHALIRAVSGLFELFFLFGAPALMIALCSKRFRRLGDHLAGTVVVRYRTGAPAAGATRFLPLPGWEGFTAHLDTSRMSREHFRLVRAYLLRHRSLPPATRAGVGAAVLAETAAAMGMDPSLAHSLQGYDPVIPLSAIAAGYQRRFSPDPVAPPGSWQPVPAGR